MYSKRTVSWIIVLLELLCSIKVYLILLNSAILSNFEKAFATLQEALQGHANL